MILSADKFGFYTVGERKTYSRMEAQQYSKLHQRQIHWNFNDEIFSKCDFTKEPTSTLSELYTTRCHQIRNAYDYVVIFYSGGNDSDNILQHWLKSGCKLDEVATMWSYEGTKDKQSYSDIEQTKVVIPKITELQKQYDFKFRLVDRTHHILDYIQRESESLIYNSNFNISPHSSSKSQLRERVKEWRDIIDSGKKLCFVWGIDKIHLQQRGDLVGVTFEDTMDSVLTPYVQRKFTDGWYDELFYWTPDLPSLIIKQAHVINNFLNYRIGVVDNVLHLHTDNRTNFGFNKVLQKHLTEDGYRKLMYPYWDPSTFTIGKSTDTMVSRRDQWLWSSNHNTCEIFLNIAKTYKQTIFQQHVSKMFYSLT